MNENVKTLVFFGTAVVVLGLGIWLSTPPAEPDAREEIGKYFFPELAEVTGPQVGAVRKVASAEIVELDSQTGARNEIKVSRVDGVFKINPERQGYDQVSLDRLAQVIDAVLGVRKLTIVSDDPARHGEFNVVDPTSDDAGDKAGKRVTLKDDNGKTLVDLIVGKIDDTIKSKDKTQATPVVYVRTAGRDRVYTTELNASRLTSTFADWVPGDLLDVAKSELQSVFADDYGMDLLEVKQAGLQIQGLIQMTVGRVIDARGEFKKADGKWTVGKLETYDKSAKKYVERKPAQDEDVATSKLDALGTALAGLKVVDVLPRPPVMVEELLAGKDILNDIRSPVWKDRESVTALRQAGFRPQPVGSSAVEYVCHDGEMVVGYSNGVRYHLRFGDITGKGSGDQGEQPADGKAEGAAAEGAKDTAAETGKTASQNRYLMVSATFDQSLIPPPKKTELPPETEAKTPTDEKKPSDEKKTAADAKPAPSDAKAEEQKKPADEKKAVEQAAEPKPSGDGCDGEDQVAQVEPSAEAEAAKQATAEADKKTTEKKDDDKPAVEKAGESKAGDEKPADKQDADAKDADAKDADAKDEAKKEAEAKPAEPKVVEPKMTPEERERIKTENEQKQKDYDQAVAAGREKAKTLNDQFSQWFYVISDETFERIHFDPLSVIEKKAPTNSNEPPAGAGPQMPGLPNLNLSPK